MQTERNCGMMYSYPPMMMPMMPFNQETNSIEQRLMDIEKRLTILEANLNNKNLNNNIMGNYQMI